MDFHPHAHALVADGLFVRSGLFYVLPDASLKPLEELFRARVIAFLVEKGLLPPERTNMLRGWVHSGFNVHRSRRNKMRGQRDKRAAEEAQAAGNAVAIIDASEHKPRRIPSAKWLELIKKVWEADPLLGPRCSKEMRIVSLIDAPAVIERILRHLGLWEQGVRVSPARAPPEIVDRVIEPCFDDPFPDYDTEPVHLSSKALAWRMVYANA